MIKRYIDAGRANEEIWKQSNLHFIKDYLQTEVRGIQDNIDDNLHYLSQRNTKALFVANRPRKTAPVE